MRGRCMRGRCSVVGMGAGQHQHRGRCMLLFAFSLLALLPPGLQQQEAFPLPLPVRGDSGAGGEGGVRLSSRYGGTGEGYLDVVAQEEARRVEFVQPVSRLAESGQAALVCPSAGVALAHASVVRAIYATKAWIFHLKAAGCDPTEGNARQLEVERDAREAAWARQLGALRGRSSSSARAGARSAAGSAAGTGAPQLVQFEALLRLPPRQRAATKELMFGQAVRFCEHSAPPEDGVDDGRVPTDGVVHAARYNVSGARVDTVARRVGFRLVEHHSLEATAEADDALREALAHLPRGGSSFLVRLEGPRIVICSVADRFDGSYDIDCPMTAHDLCRLGEFALNLRLDFTHFGAFQSAKALRVRDERHTAIYSLSAEPAAIDLLRGCRFEVGDARAGGARADGAGPAPATRQCSAAELGAAGAAWGVPEALHMAFPGDAGPLAFEGTPLAFAVPGCEVRPPRDSVRRCVDAAHRVALVGSSHMRFAYDAMLHYAGHSQAAAHKHADALSVEAGLEYVAAPFASQVVTWAEALAANDARVSGNGSLAVVVLQTGAWDFTMCGAEDYLTRTALPFLEAVERLAAAPAVRAAGTLVLSSLMPSYPTHVGATWERRQRTGRNMHSLMAAAQLERAWLRAHDLPVADYAIISEPLNDMQADVGGHYLVPLRDRDTGELQGVIGPVGEAFLSVVAQAVCSNKEGDGVATSS